MCRGGAILIKPIHPFPARMAPEIAIEELRSLKKGSVILDPMMGSGTVVRHAIEAGHSAKGFDLDPLAVLMSRVWSTAVDDRVIEAGLATIEDILPSIDGNEIQLPWIDEDAKTKDFVDFWFGAKQKRDLRRLSFALEEFGKSSNNEQTRLADVMKIALSRIIITKCGGASLAHDVSHSRPHKVMQASEYDVLVGFRKSMKQVRDRLKQTPRGSVMVAIGDARLRNRLREGKVDMILTSPPYLNAIDYMRGHKLSLVWLGHSISQLSAIRSLSVGAERKCDVRITESAKAVQRAMVDSTSLASRDLAMVERYSHDLHRSLEQAARALKPGGRAIYVVGNSCLRGTFIKNSEGVKKAASAAGLCLISERSRELPSGSRYLPMPASANSALGKRMRTESVITFEKAA